MFRMMSLAISILRQEIATLSDMRKRPVLQGPINKVHPSSQDGTIPRRALFLGAMGRNASKRSGVINLLCMRSSLYSKLPHPGNQLGIEE